MAASPIAPVFIRAAVARADIESGSLDVGERLAASLPPGPERADLEGDLLVRRGDLRRAVSRFIAAGDTSRVDAYVDDLIAVRSFQLALITQLLLVARLQQLDDDGQFAQAESRLAQIESATGNHVAATRDYDVALRLFPLSETYLLGAANEALQFGKLNEARDYFTRVVALDSASLDGHIGVGRVEAREGNLEGARHEVELVRGRDPKYRDLPVLEREISAKSKP